MNKDTDRAERQQEIPPDSIRKPDPDEPWRFVCPECKRQVVGHPRTLKYECCGGCGSFERSELIDRKQTRPSEQ